MHVCNRSPLRLTQAASASWEELKSQTSASLKKAVRDRKQLELDITLQSPFLILPEKGLYTENVNLIVADLGKLSVYGHTSDNRSTTIEVCAQYHPQKWVEPLVGGKV